MRRDARRHIVPLGRLLLIFLAASCSSTDPEELRGVWIRQGLPTSDFSYLSIDVSSGGLALEADSFGFTTGGTAMFHGHEVAPFHIGVRAGRSTGLDPLEIEWGSGDRLELLFVGIDVRAASWSEIPPARLGYGASFEPLVSNAGTPGLRLPPALARELGVGADEVLLRGDPRPAFTPWLAPEDATGRWQSTNWPASLLPLADGGLAVTDWPATRLEVEADAGFRLFRLVEGRAFAAQGRLTGTAERRWLFESGGTPPVLVLDDGAQVEPEPEQIAGTPQRTWQYVVNDYTSPDAGEGASGLVVTGIESSPLKRVTAP